MNINRITTLSGLQTIPVPRDTSTYKSYSHSELDRFTKENLEKEGFHLSNTQYLVAREGQLAIGKYFIDYGNDPHMKYMLVWQNSYNKQLSLKYVSGAVLNICMNGMIFGDIDSYFVKRHQSDIQIITPEIIKQYITEGANNFNNIIHLRDQMKNIEITKRTSAELIGRMFIEESIINATQVGIIKKELEAPTFDYGANRSLWELYQHCTFASRELHPSNYIKGHQDIHKFLTNEYGIKIPNKEVKQLDLEEAVELAHNGQY